MPLYTAQGGDLDRCYRCLTDGQTLKDRATQLLLKFKSGALVTQFANKSEDDDDKEEDHRVVCLTVKA